MLTPATPQSDAVDPAAADAVNDSACTFVDGRPPGPSWPRTVPEPTAASTDRSTGEIPDGTADVETGSAASLPLEERFSIIPEWVLDADISDAAVRLYAVLLRFGATSGQRMPSRRTLAARLRKKSVDSVDRALRELVAVGAVEVTHRSRHGASLTNRYLVRSSPPGSPSGRGRGGGGRTDAATPIDPPPPAPAAIPTAAASRACRQTGDGRRTAATRGRTDAATLAAAVRPDREFLTETPPPPGPSSIGPTGHTRTAARPGRAARLARVLAVLGVDDLTDVAARCARLRRGRGLPAGLWTAEHLADVLADALDAGWPAAAAIPALLAVAADPATRSPARLSCPGPWWDQPTPTGRGPQGSADRVAELEAVLGETGGLRVVLQRQARADLTAHGVPLNRLTVARRAVELLTRRNPDEAPEGSASVDQGEAGDLPNPRWRCRRSGPDRAAPEQRDPPRR